MSSNPKILVVDDFEMMRFQLKTALAALGYGNVVEAADGNAATDLLLSSDGSFDIIFCDWNMPNLNGIGVLEFCRAMPNLERIPFVMVTAEAEQEAVVKAIKAGANDYIVKPFAGDALQKRLSAILAKHLKKQAA
ncbi:MAG: response regulator [Bdellovibrionota bacterium]